MTSEPVAGGASGIHTDELDDSVRPQDDLFRHVNGRWIARTPIPEDRARWGSFLVLAEEAERAVHEIIERATGAAPGTDEHKFGQLYASFMDTERIEQLGAAPLEPLLARIAEVGDRASFLRLLGEFDRAGIGGVVQLFVDNDPGRPDRYLVFLEQSGLGLPDESYYREEAFAAIREQYVAFIERMLDLAGIDDAATRASRVFELETRLASAHWDRVRSRDSEATYNPMAFAAADELTGGALAGWAGGLGVPEHALAEVVVRQPSFLEGLGALLPADGAGGEGADAADLEAWRDWMRFHVVRAHAPYLSDAFVQANFDFSGRVISGTPQLRARWKRGVALVEGAMGEAVGRAYVAEHFRPEAKAAMDDLVGNLIEAYRDSIRTLSWMTDDTKTRALEKLDKFTPKIGFPVKWRDYSALEFDASDLIGNVRASNEFDFQRELGKIGKPIDRDEWFMTPQTINAYYNPGFNEIVFPAAILQFPFFDEQRDAAANYGAIGAVIGHEIGHGFDDQGSRFDGDGRLTDWWTADDRAAFEQLTASLIAQYDALEPEVIPGHHVNGALTIGENIGDLGGLGIAWKAYRRSLGDAEAPELDGLTGPERFFLSWAQAWRETRRDEEALRLLSIDPHSPPEFRCNQIVRNLEPFYTAFGVQQGDAAWLEPDARVTIW